MVGFNLIFAKIQKTHHTAKRYATYFIDKSTSKASLEILSFYDDLHGPTKVSSDSVEITWATTTRIVSLSSLFSYPE